MFHFTITRKNPALFLATFSIITTTLNHAIAQAQTRFNDLQNHWAQTCIQELANQRILNGYPDGSFRPNAPVTRAEFAAMIETAFPNAASVRTNTQFVDVPSTHWAGNAIGKAYRSGFLSGYPNRVFNPNQPIPRVQVLVALANGLNYAPAQSASLTLNQSFRDAQTIPDYARNAIAAATENRLVVNYPNARSLNPNQLATRGDVAAFLCQAGVVNQTAIAPLQTYIPQTRVNEIRGVWLTNIDSEVLFSRQALSAALQRLRQMNFNTVYPTVWNWGYTLYPSAVAERVIGRSVDPTPGLQRRDMLREITQQAPQQNLRVIPWFEFGFMAPADSDLVKRNPTWITSRRNGDQIWKEGTHDRVWLNPFHPAVQQFLLDLVVEIVGNYDVDGIQFDDHMGLPVEFGYDPYTVELYKQEHNNQLPPVNPRDPEWRRWRADKITEFMGRIFQAVKAKKPNAIVGVSPNPYHFAYPEHLQDWATWERRGFIEELIVQIYRPDINRFTRELEYEEVQNARRHIPVAVGILTGLKGRPSSLAQIQTQIETVRNRGFAGVSFFFYESLFNWADETPAQREAAFREYFPAAVEAPNILEDWNPPE